VGDTLVLHRKGTLPNGRNVNDEVPFGRATVLSVVEKPFSELTEEDMQGQERFASREAMVQTYQGYYPDAEVTLATPVKIIRFELQSP
jgi:hypothetical protein